MDEQKDALFWFMALCYAKWHRNVKTYHGVKAISRKYKMGFRVLCTREAHKSKARFNFIYVLPLFWFVNNHKVMT